MNRPATTIRATPPLVWRVTESELDLFCPWLLPSLQKRWPRLSSDGISFWFKSAIGDRRTLFARTANMVGMWHALADILEPTITVVEKFVRGSGSENNEEAIVLYRYMKEWATQIRARECVFGMDTDASMTAVTQAIQSLKTPCRKKAIYALSMQEEE